MREESQIELKNKISKKQFGVNYNEIKNLKYKKIIDNKFKLAKIECEKWINKALDYF